MTKRRLRPSTHKLYWGRVWAQTEIHGCWVRAKVRPRWYWWLEGLSLFLGVVWRRACDGGDRIDVRTAWAVSRAAWGLTGPLAVHRELAWPLHHKET